MLEYPQTINLDFGLKHNPFQRVEFHTGDLKVYTVLCNPLMDRETLTLDESWYYKIRIYKHDGTTTYGTGAVNDDDQIEFEILPEYIDVVGQAKAVIEIYELSDEIEIESFAEGDVGTVIESTAHGLHDGDVIQITEGDYYGEYTIFNVDTNTFEIIAEYVVPEGEPEQPSEDYYQYERRLSSSVFYFNVKGE